MILMLLKTRKLEAVQQYFTAKHRFSGRKRKTQNLCSRVTFQFHVISEIVKKIPMVLRLLG